MAVVTEIVNVTSAGDDGLKVDVRYESEVPGGKSEDRSFCLKRSEFLDVSLFEARMEDAGIRQVVEAGPSHRLKGSFAWRPSWARWKAKVVAGEV